MKKVVLFTGSFVSWSLIRNLIENKTLAALVVPPVGDPQLMNMLQVLQQNNIAVFQQNENNEPQLIEALKGVKADIGITFLYELVLSKELFSLFPEGCFNFHPSPLPKYRGVQPLYWQIINSESKSALTAHKVTEKVNEGDIASQEEFSIESEDTLGSLYAKAGSIAPLLLNNLINTINDNKVDFIKQGDFTFHTKPTHKNFIIDWRSENSKAISQKAKAGNPVYGGVQTTIKSHVISILEASVVKFKTYGAKEGTIIYIGAEGLVVATIDGAIRLDVVSTAEGVFSGYIYAIASGLNPGEKFQNLQ